MNESRKVTAEGSKGSDYSTLGVRESDPACPPPIPYANTALIWFGFLLQTSTFLKCFPWLIISV